MPMTSYCKKCACDVPVGDFCERCGGKLPRSAVRVAWCVSHHPVRDWMCWNALMRILLPVAAVALVLTLTLEGFLGGAEGIETLLRSGLPQALLMLMMTVMAAVLLIFILQGEDWQDCAVDSRGIHVSCYLPNPTPLKLMLRLRSPALLREIDPADEVPTVLLSQQDLAWRDIARVQLWPEKTLILFYAPVWWMRLALPCTPFTYEDSMTFIHEKLGRKKSVQLPQELRTPPPPKADRPVKHVSVPNVLPTSEPAATLPEDFPPPPATPPEPSAGEELPPQVPEGQ
ncbi:MAG: hypothetical protein ACI4MJ_07625 [Aristaeellaceae bacterium]